MNEELAAGWCEDVSDGAIAINQLWGENKPIFPGRGFATEWWLSLVMSIILMCIARCLAIAILQTNQTIVPAEYVLFDTRWF